MICQYFDEKNKNNFTYKFKKGIWISSVRKDWIGDKVYSWNITCDLS